MVDERVVMSGLAYLEQCRTENTYPTLCGMVGAIDRRHRIISTTEEINEVLRRSPSLQVQRINGRVHFSPQGLDRRITSEDLERAFADYDLEVDADRRKRRAELK
jgi:hypothetical protein